MKKLLAIAVAASALMVAAPASAQAWQSINQRQAQLDQRIDMGVRNGSLTRAEAVRLRGEFNDLARLEARYRVNGLSYSERADLDRRFDALSARIRYERHDGQDRRDAWMPINQRQRQLDERIDVGVRNGSLTRTEAARLRAEFNGLSRLEARYRANGLSMSERADLDRRFDALSARIRYERHDSQDRRDAWVPINQRQRQLDQRIDAGRRDGSLSRQEELRLRAEFRQIADLEARYRRGGLSMGERRDLDMRFDRLSTRIMAERRDRNNWYG